MWRQFQNGQQSILQQLFYLSEQETIFHVVLDGVELSKK